MKKALITGITGQDGSYLAEFLLNKGYEVHGIVRRAALESPEARMSRINHIKDKITLHGGSMESFSRILQIIDEVNPDEVYHLAAQSFVHESFDDSFTTFNTNINGTHHMLAALNMRAPKAKFYFAGSSEQFGKVEETPQSEHTKFHPRSPYGITKCVGFELTRNYREAHGMFACTGLLFNHESPRRGHEFVTRKITQQIARIKKGQDNVLVIGNMEARRDWGFAGDYVEAMWLMLQQAAPEDYVAATGVAHSVREFVQAAFKGVDLSFEEIDLHHMSEELADAKVAELRQERGKIFVVQHPRFFRPAEVNLLQGDATKAKQVLGWQPKVQFEELVKMMVERDLNEV
ncbi:GDP-mannose 4,6-dehydratase [Candidatus Woesearchaeota archaeon]|nr:GDP-mannose 4,6-dehydratase [Candidatus Woesearchaeota archaeon]